MPPLDPSRRTAVPSSLLGLALSQLLGAFALSAQELPHRGELPTQAATLIPTSVRAEHEEIQHDLQRAMKTPGPVGVAARDLMEVLDPHFRREEQIALPPLGVLRPMIAGSPPRAVVALVTAMSDSLRAELPQMLAQHKEIAAALRRLEAAARARRDSGAVALALRLRLHAQNEEEVMYPAAVLVGEVLRGRAAPRENPAR